MKDSPVLKDGVRVAVLRPQDPAKALARAREIQGTNDKAAFDAILTEQPYTFAGILGTRGTVLDDDGNVIGSLVSGDSFANLEHVLRAFRASAI